MLLILDNRVNKADLLVLIIENGIVISEEVETEDPVSLGWSVHEFDNALVSLFGKPLISWNFVNFIVTIEFKVDIRNSACCSSVHSQDVRVLAMTSHCISLRKAS